MRDRASGAQSRHDFTQRSNQVNLAQLVNESLPACSIAESFDAVVMTAQMGRGPIIFGFWLLGYALGFVAYLVRVPFVIAITALFGSANADLVGAAVSGLAGSLMMLVFLLVWSHMGSSS